MFLFLILIHEFGHFLLAKKSGIQVNEFAVGMGPCLYSKQKGETKYSINLLPIGGYCAMEGEDEDSENPRSFGNASPYKRFATIAAGPVVNLLFASLIFFVIFMAKGTSSRSVGSFTESSPLEETGFQVGDEIVEVGGREIKEFSEISQAVNSFYKGKKEGDKIPVKAKREDGFVEGEVPAKEEGGSFYLGFYPGKEELGFFKSLAYGFRETGRNMKMIWQVLVALFSGKVSFSAVSGPVGVVKELGNQASQGASNLFYFLAYISVNLGFFNLLPIPALDGSKLIEAIYQMITKKKMNQKFVEVATTVGFIFLMGLILLVTIKDVLRLF